MENDLDIFRRRDEKKKKKKKSIQNKLFESMALKSGIDLEVLNSQSWPCFTSQFHEDPKPMPEK